MSKTATVKLTSAITVSGEIVTRGSIITIPEDAAKDLLRRGKAVVATAEDETESDLEDLDDEVQVDPAPVDPAPPAPPAAEAKPAAKPKK